MYKAASESILFQALSNYKKISVCSLRDDGKGERWEKLFFLLHLIQTALYALKTHCGME